MVLALCCLAYLSARLVHAAEYELFIDVDSEEELYDLYLSDQISEDTFDALMDIYRKGVNLNTASRDELYTLPNLTYRDVDRILTYREEVGRIEDPAALVAANVVDQRKLGAIAMFLVKDEQRPKLTATKGFVRYQTSGVFGNAATIRNSPGDIQVGSTGPTPGGSHQLPAMAFQARIATFRYLTIGGGLLVTRRRLGEVAWDPTRQALSAEQEQPRVVLPKLFAMWDTGKWGVIAGTYRIGFGQRLTFDSSNRYTPNGFYQDDTLIWVRDAKRLCGLAAGEQAGPDCDGDPDYVYQTGPDWRWRDAQRGLAVGAKHIDLPTGWLSAFAWGSYDRRDIYQYEIYDRGACADPRLDDDPACAAPSVFRRNPDDLLAPQNRYAYQTLPNMYDEALGGANITWFARRRLHVGVTGYAANVQWRQRGVDLDFQEYSRLPFGGPFGAVGADFAWGRRWADIFLEATHTFNSQTESEGDRPNVGGPGVLLRHTATWNKNEIEASARYYGENFKNPYARPIASADEFEGVRARDEVGGRIRYTGLIKKRLDLRSLLDVWVQPNETSRDISANSASTKGARPQVLTYIRADVQATKWLRPGLWLQWQSRDLRYAGGLPDTDDFSICFESLRAQTVEGELKPCAGQKFQLWARLGTKPHKRVGITAQYQHGWLDDPNRGGGLGEKLTEEGKRVAYRQDNSVWLILTAKPVDELRLRFRARYRSQDINALNSLEESFWTYVDAAYLIKKLALVRLRYDVYWLIDSRDATRQRVPNPEHWLRGELEFRF